MAADQDEMESELELLKLKRLGLTVLDMRKLLTTGVKTSLVSGLTDAEKNTRAREAVRRLGIGARGLSLSPRSA